MRGPTAKQRKALEAHDAAMQMNAETASTYAEQLRQLLNVLVNQGTLVDDDINKLDDLRKTLDLVAYGLDTYSVAMQVTTMEGCARTRLSSSWRRRWRPTRSSTWTAASRWSSTAP